MFVVAELVLNILSWVDYLRNKHSRRVQNNWLFNIGRAKVGTVAITFRPILDQPEWQIC